MTAAALPWNQNEKLEPPNGGWRGAVVDRSRFDSVDDWQSTYGFPLHIKRVFKGNNWQHLTDDELAFAQSGGILFYTIPISHPQTFADYIGTEGEWRIQQFADVIKPLAPAKVLVTIRYEPELWVDESKPDKYLGTPAEYRQLWQSLQDGFASAGVTNAVWAMDYSSEAAKTDKHPLLAALWPGDGKIDWLFWNLFEFGSDKKRTFTDMFETAYDAFEANSGVAQQYGNETNTADYTTAKFWGLGAWGADVKSGTEEERAAFIQESAEALGSGKYTRFKAQVYFDTYDANSNTGSIIRDGQLDAYAELNGQDFFTVNDNGA
mmetsp:Transcript_3200/g.7679  ORF Transcript_3200/g.7679 Transcript_3200/m.7679 type:complete len:321 (+) Transcript_3200:72-1034(+)